MLSMTLFSHLVGNLCDTLLNFTSYVLVASVKVKLTSFPNPSQTHSRDIRNILPTLPSQSILKVMNSPFPSFVPLIQSLSALCLGHKLNLKKNLAQNLQYRPRTRLTRGTNNFLVAVKNKIEFSVFTRLRKQMYFLVFLLVEVQQYQTKGALHVS